MEARVKPDRRKNVLALAVLSVIFIALIFYIASSRGASHTPTNNLSILTAFSPITYLVEPVVGGHANVTQMVGPGVNPNSYEPTPSESNTLWHARVIFFDSPGLENWVFQTASEENTGILLVPLIQDINGSSIKNNTNMTLTNPYFWLDPAVVPPVVNTVQTIMTLVDPKNATYYASNANALIAGIEALNRSYAEGLAHCQSRILIDSSPFMGYVALGYNLTEIPIQGGSGCNGQLGVCSAGDAQQQVINAINNGSRGHVHSIFIEGGDALTSADQNVTLALNATVYNITTMEVLTPQEISSGANYTSIMYQNLQTLVKGLNCTST